MLLFGQRLLKNSVFWVSFCGDSLSTYGNAQHYLSVSFIVSQILPFFHFHYVDNCTYGLVLVGVTAYRSNKVKDILVHVNWIVSES